MIFTVASHRGLTDEYIYAKPVGWLFYQYEESHRARYEEWLAGVSGLEIGLMRGLGILLGSKGNRLPKLPGWDEVSNKTRAAEKAEGKGQPSFAEKFARANKIAWEPRGAKRGDGQ
jgi:hypothetical protein